VFDARREAANWACLQNCIKEFFDSNNHNTNTCANIDDFGLCIASMTSTFACVVQVTCHCGKHSFLVEPPWRKMKEDKESAQNNTNATNKMGHPISTHQIRDYGINYLAFLLTQVIGNGITSKP